MKKSTAFGAVLCSAALAMGMALPAFAAGEDVEVVTVGNAGDFTENTANTVINGVVVSSGTPVEEEMIKATVPLNVTIALASESGPFAKAPSTGKYAIINTGKLNIELSGISAQVSTNGWSLDAVPATDEEYADQTSGTPTSPHKIALAVGGFDVTKSTSITGVTIMSGTQRAMDITGGTKLAKSATTGTPSSLEAGEYNNLVTVKYTIKEAGAVA